MAPKIAFNIMVTSALLFSHNDSVFSALNSIVVTPGHINATMNVRMAKFDNNQMLRGDYHITNSSPLIITALPGSTSSWVNLDFKANSALSLLGSDQQGNDTWSIGFSGYGIEPFFIDTDGDLTPQYIQSDSSITLRYSADQHYSNVTDGWSDSIPMGVDVVSVVSLNQWSPSLVPQGATHSEVISLPQPIALADITGSEVGENDVNIPVLYLDTLNIHTTVSSCGILSKQGSVVNWPSLYGDDIITGTVETKPYSLSLICGRDTDPQTQVDINISAAGGAANNVGDNVVNTGFSGVGLKLTWQNTNLPPLSVNKINTSMLSGVGDYTVLAQPVATGGTIGTGVFDTNVTLDIDFH